METIIASGLRGATVFLQGAELVREATAKLLPGRNIVCIAGLPEELRPESVTAKAEEGAQIISAAFRVNHLEEPGATARVKELGDRLKSLEERLRGCDDALALIEAESEFLRQNQQIGGKQGVQLDTLRVITEYYRGRMTELAAGRLAQDTLRETLQEEHERLKRELGECSERTVRGTGEIVIELSSPAEAEAALTVSYYVDTAGWTPSYEIRVADMKSPATLIGKAKIVQNTGEDWQDLPVILSSGTPSHGGRQPKLTPWYLDIRRAPSARIYEPGRTPVLARMMSAPFQDAMAAEEDDEDEAHLSRAMPARPKARRPAPAIQQAQTSVEFALPEAVTVETGEDGRTVEILRHELPAEYQHYCVRKLDRDVFLLAKIKGWEKLNLLAGSAGVFLGNTFVGTTEIDPRAAEDVLELSLGRDSGVLVTRVKGRDFAARSVLGKNQKASRQWLITARNTRRDAVELRLLDQIPVSVNKMIEVEPAELSGGQLDKETGEVCWTLKLEPGQAAELKLGYTVSYPKNQPLSLE